MHKPDFQIVKFSINELTIEPNSSHNAADDTPEDLPGIEMVAYPFQDNQSLPANVLGVVYLVALEWEDTERNPLLLVKIVAIAGVEFEPHFTREAITAYDVNPICQILYTMAAGVIAQQTASATYGQYIFPNVNVADFLNKPGSDLIISDTN